ncbi:MAG: D-3-phosphoglycerate dehydrogenase [Parasphingorhabdus sp.]|jgi:D-3-phosphoglycerate dehydrogenase
MKILFADIFPVAWSEKVTQLGYQADHQSDLSETDLVSAIGDAEILVVRSTKVNAEAMAAATNLKLVIRAGAGTNTIDKPAAKQAGIAVCNTPGRNAVAVAELAMGLILSIDRNIPDNVADLRRGVWNKKGYSKANGIFGSTLGVLGLGAIGMELIVRARAFGMNVLVVSKPGRDEKTLQSLDALQVEQVADMQTLAARSDFISAHLPATAETTGILGGNLFDAMKPGAVIINTSRGEILDETALLKAMDKKGLRAGLDVYANEPGASDNSFNSAIAAHANVYGTHHIGASTEQAQDAVAEGVYEVIASFKEGTILNCVNGVG